MAAPPSSFAGVGDPRVRTVLRETKTIFNTVPSFSFDKLLGFGAGGVVCRVIERGPRKTKSGVTKSPRRLVVKRAISAKAEAELLTEIEFLKQLRGAEHISRMIASHDGSVPQPSGLLNQSLKAVGMGIGWVLGGARSVQQKPPQTPQHDNYDSIFKGIKGPLLIVEYLENGELRALLGKLMVTGIMLPNRVLWAFCLCAVRACIACAYPPEGDDETPNSLERIEPNQPREFLGHGDIHGRNIMIGNRGIDFREHSLVPPLKLIDFGRAKAEPLDYNKMIHDLFLCPFELIGERLMQEILSLITRTMSWHHKVGGYRGFATYAIEILHRDEYNCPEGNGGEYPTIDDELRHFLARCTATSLLPRPSLSQMFAEAYAGANKPASAYGPRAEAESDATIERILSQVLFDANIEAPVEDPVDSWEMVGGNRARQRRPRPPFQRIISYSS
ncbi:hypothetical protein F5Y10DRAFT_265145 [Nemania abortiva]|nr:hypothetical protein F5Y10DRAFT_265145 [Nemania abortiva]